MLILCSFHILQQVWRFLWESSTGVKKDERPDILKKFRDSMYAQDVSDFEDIYTQLLLLDSVILNEKLFPYLLSLYASKKQWAHCFRIISTLRGQQTNNIAEHSFLVLKDTLLARKKCINVIQLSELLSKQLESFYQISIFNNLNSKYVKANFKKAMQKAKDEDMIVLKVDECTFIVNYKYLIDTKLGDCTCPVGVNGAFCKHQAAVKIQHESYHGSMGHLYPIWR